MVHKIYAAIVSFFTTKHVPFGRERDFCGHEREMRRNFGEFMLLSRAACYLLFITAGTVVMERGKIFNIEQ